MFRVQWHISTLVAYCATMKKALNTTHKTQTRVQYITNKIHTISVQKASSLTETTGELNQNHGGETSWNR